MRKFRIKLSIFDIYVEISRKNNSEIVCKNNTYDVGFDSWSHAEKISAGYDSDAVFEKVTESSRLVRDGKFPYERDGVVFEKIR